jgi:hypothetical protein
MRGGVLNSNWASVLGDAAFMADPPAIWTAFVIARDCAGIARRLWNKRGFLHRPALFPPQ